MKTVFSPVNDAIDDSDDESSIDTCLPSEMDSLCLRLQLYELADQVRTHLKDYNASGITPEDAWIETHLGNIDSDALHWINSFYV